MLASPSIGEFENFLRNSVMRVVLDALEDTGNTEDFMVEGGVESGRFLGEYLRITLSVRRNSTYGGSNVSPVHKHVNIAVFELIENRFHIVCRAVSPGQELPSRAKDEVRFKISTKEDFYKISNDLKRVVKKFIVHASMTKIIL